MDALVLYAKDVSPLALVAFGIGTLVIGRQLVKKLSNPPDGLVYPPGPPQDPIIGSFRSFPKEEFYRTFCDWQKKYGDIVYLYLPGMPIMIINSYDMAHELLSKRASNVSGRKTPYMIRELLGWSWTLTMRQPDSIHQLSRKLLRRGIGPQGAASRDPLIEKSTLQLVLELQEKSGNPRFTIVHAIARIVIQVTYGERIWNDNGLELVDLNIKAGEILFTTFNRLWMVDLIPLLRFIPSWMPGAEFRRRGIASTTLVDRIRYWPFQRSLELHANKELGPCLISDLLDEYGPLDEVRDALAVSYFAGVDTTSGAIVHALHSIFLFPEIARKMQTEIDRVVGNERLPKGTDREQLPYTEAVWKECLRWNTSFPATIPHVNTKEEIINGYYIPKGTLLNPNIGFMLSDPKMWGDPEIFRPERHLNKDSGLPNPTVLVFGFGSRICPGMHLADRIGFHTIATIMSMYNILPLEGAALPDWRTVEYVGDTIRFPKHFDCRFMPRNEKAIHLLSSLSLSETF